MTGVRQGQAGPLIAGAAGQVMTCLGGEQWNAQNVPGVAGPANTFGFFDAAGNLTGDTDLTALPIDVFGRPQLRDIRQAAGVGAVWRQGAWQADGDPTNQTGEGIVIYDPDNAAEGNFGRVKGNRFQIRRIVAGGLDGSAFRVDTTEMFMQEDVAGARVMEVRRSDGRAFFGVLHIGSNTGPRKLAGAGTPEGVEVGNRGDTFARTDGGAGTCFYVKEAGDGLATGWVAK